MILKTSRGGSTTGQNHPFGQGRVNFKALTNSSLVHDPGQGDVKAAPSTRLALYPNLTAMFFDDLFDLAQAN